MTQPRPAGRRTGRVVAIVVAVLVVAVAAWFAITKVLLGDDAGDTVDRGDEKGAYAACVDEVSGLLERPADATFADVAEADIDREADTFTITSWVQPAPADGDQRTTWTCTATYAGQDSWDVTAELDR